MAHAAGMRLLDSGRVGGEDRDLPGGQRQVTEQQRQHALRDGAEADDDESAGE